MPATYDRVATEARWDREDHGPAADAVHPSEYAGHVDPIAEATRREQADARAKYPPVNAGPCPWCAGTSDVCCTTVTAEAVAL